ncbi:unnamed protein product [Anisakis simplex]|uniref:Uncharacterized protein n=1 Tax=Anisakis simplex TaxID=6269 RepID=A0A0M3IY49_ANISI|nr:unnamed protein product [Anisakis simplex]
MHRLSRLSATFSSRFQDLQLAFITLNFSKKNELEIVSLASGETDGFQRPNALSIVRSDTSEERQAVPKADEEWFEFHSVTPTSDAHSPIAIIVDHNQHIPSSSNLIKDEFNQHSAISSSSKNVAESCNNVTTNDPVADIEIMEKSLISLLDDFRSGRMNALSEERLNQMRNARKDMEELTAFHVKLHRQQLSNQPTSTDAESLDEQYDALFRRLDELHSSM